MTQTAVHPRVYGEHFYWRSIYRIDGGSSPRVRGTLLPRWIATFKRRFIPACTGNTCHLSPTPTCHAVHPRVYGEHGGGGKVNAGRSGSSPRVRGTRQAALIAKQAARFIPACTGNTRRNYYQSPSTSVHPRVYGEHGWSGWRIFPPRGSSPRVRGTR